MVDLPYKLELISLSKKMIREIKLQLWIFGKMN